MCDWLVAHIFPTGIGLAVLIGGYLLRGERPCQVIYSTVPLTRATTTERLIYHIMREEKKTWLTPV